jgi:tetratricopeptide (TPR) repeat protein
MTTLACPDEMTLARLTRGELDRPLGEAVLFHLEHCGSCSSALESLAPGWSRQASTTPADALSTFTRNVRDRLAATPPSLPQGGGRSAAIPRAIPVLPGLADLEPRSRGGMGIVYRACDAALHRQVAVKLLWPASAGSQTAWARAKREAVVLGRISHANVVAVYSAGEAEGIPYLVMEWVDGPSLQQRIDTGLPTPRQAARIVRDLARAVAAVHSLGIIHRDIKPDNVLLAGPDASDWDCCVPKLADFGLARPAEFSQQLTHDAAALGTPAYMAPEQTGLAAELGEPGPAADIHGLGGLAFALLAGTPPHQAATAAASLQQAARSEITWPAACRRLPRDLRAIVGMCLERQPSRRYASASQLADDLHRFVAGLPVRARPASPLRRLARTVRRRPVLTAAVGLSAMFAAAAGGGLAYHLATVAAARIQIDRSEHLAQHSTGVAARSMRRLTGELIEQMIHRSRPDDTGHIDFLREIRDEFAGWPLGNEPVEALRFRIKGLERVSRLFADVSCYDEAVDCHERLLALLDELAALQPRDTRCFSQRLASLHAQRTFLYHLGRTDEAVASARRSLATLELAPPDLPDRGRAKAGALLDLGIFLHEQQRYHEGNAAFDDALAQLRELRAAEPTEFSLLAQEAHALVTAEVCSWNSKHFEECRRWTERLVHEIGAVLDAPQPMPLTVPQRSYLSQMVSMGFKRLSRLAAEEGSLEEAIELAESRRRLCLAAAEPLPGESVHGLHEELVDAHLEAAGLLERAGRLAEATATLDEAAETIELLEVVAPGVWDHAALLSRVCQQRGRLAAVRGERSVAAEWFGKVITLMEPQLAKPAHRRDTEACIALARAGLRDFGKDAGGDARTATDTRSVGRQ